MNNKRIALIAAALGAAVLRMARLLFGAAVCAAILTEPAAVAAAGKEVDADKVYRMVYGATLDPTDGVAHVSLSLEQPRQLVRSIEFTMPSDRYRNIRPTSRIEVKGDRVTWRPLKQGSVLRFDFVIDHRRVNGALDARVTPTWALFKLDHLFPPSRARVVKGATSEAAIKLVAPAGWDVETVYGKAAGRVVDIDKSDRLLDRPLGWVLAGELAVRRDWLKNRTIAIASPPGTNPRANDTLSFIRLTMPSLLEVFPDFPQLLLIVNGSEDMWRGGLSGNASLYVHPDRPLISGNRTSTMLHELVHVGSGLHAKGGADWIVEGLAEYYGLTLLHRAGGISEQRYNDTFDHLARWSAGTQCVATDRSQGQRTAQAVLVMRALDAEIRAANRNKASLDTLMQGLVQADRLVTNADFRAAAEKLVKGPVKALAGCP